ncbi:MAG: hypothetical protein PX483_07580 [Nostocales cyanobacterium LE14-WE4]|nr:hypothetical protein [Nostocales cyanobacterium LE14-WE4]
MSVPIVDVKILWGRASGRCSMPDCRRELTHESGTLPAGAVVVGENCHIVAEKVDGPRGNYPIAEAEINRYSNLILLCSIHHKIIDTDVNAWPVEKLRQIKSDHESWIQTTFKYSDQQDALVYHHIVALASSSLMLQAWDGISDHAVRDLAYKEWISGIYNFNVVVQRAIWPGTLKSLEIAIQTLAERSIEYAEHYMTLAYMPHIESTFYQENKTWKQVWRDDYEQYAARSEAWQNNNFRMLMNMTHAVNEFVDQVRAFLDPYFFLKKGKFCIYDSLGVTNMLTECWIIPSAFKD